MTDNPDIEPEIQRLARRIVLNDLVKDPDNHTFDARKLISMVAGALQEVKRIGEDKGYVRGYKDGGGRIN